MKYFATLLLAFALVAPASAQSVSASATPAADLIDDGYIGVGDENDGTGEDAGMTCAALDFSGQSDIAAVNGELLIGITHTWIGDLTIKIQSPAGTVLPVLARAAFDGPDDGTGGFGDSSNLDGASPITFVDGGATDAEMLGVAAPGTDDVTCAGDGLCEYAPNPDGAAGGTPDYIDNFAGFDGEMTSGMWSVCVGDAGAADLGTFDTVTLSFGIGVAVDADPSGEFAFGLIGANPFSGSTALGLRATTTQAVRATLHDVLGREVSTLFDGAAVAGSEVRIDVNGADLPAGTYVVRVAGETFSATRSLTLTR